MNNERIAVRSEMVDEIIDILLKDWCLDCILL